MVQLAANLTMMFTEHPFLDRFAAAADAGFAAVECLAPYEASPEALARTLKETGLKLVLFNMGIGDWAAGDRGLAADPDRVEAFRASLKEARLYALATGCSQLHVMAGKVPSSAEPGRFAQTFIDNARFAADVLRPDGVDVLFEPINTRVDIPGYLYDTSQKAVDLIEAVGRPNVKLQYDIYHMQIMEGDLARTLERLLPRIGHIQLADNPGRHEPGTGEINYPWLLSHLDALGYSGWIGCEYRPRGETLAGLGWAEPYLAGRTRDIERTLAP